MRTNFDGQELDTLAIQRLQAFEPPEGYWLAFSGGKDSVVLLDLAKRSGVKFEAHYSITNADPPELVQFIKRQHPSVARDMPQQTLWKLIEEKGLPTRVRRWCCEHLKERGGEGRVTLTGVRWGESSRRAKLAVVAFCNSGRGKRHVRPIIDWSTEEVWGYIREHHIPYCSLYDEGWKRLGCILCPMSSNASIEAKRWPKIYDAWRRAADRYWARGLPKMNKFHSSDEFFGWWLNKKGKATSEEQQRFMFE